MFLTTMTGAVLLALLQRALPRAGLHPETAACREGQIEWHVQPARETTLPS